MAWLGVLALLGVFSIALIMAGAGPGRSLRPALTALALVTVTVWLVAALS